MHISSYELCLERVAEEFMGRRKWKHYQDQLTRNQLNIAEQQPISIITTESETETETKVEDNSKNCKQLNHRFEQPNGQHFNSNNNNSNNNNNTNGALQFEKDFDDDNNVTSHDNDSSATSRSSGSPSPPPEPNDWTPSDKCNFCVNGRLLTVNTKGELVAETTTTANASSNNISISNIYNGTAVQQHDSDSNSSASLHNNSSSSNRNNNNIKNNNSNKSKHRAHTSTTTTTTGTEPYIEIYKKLAEMTSMESMAAKLAQFTMMGTMMSTLANQQQQQQQQHANSVTPTTSDASATAASPTLKDTSSPSADAPLDLSSKPSPNSSISGDIKTVRGLSETPLPAGRRAYEDLNNALQDVLQANKLGNRKASSQYHVPRSTLRNKLCKMSLDAKQQLKHELELEEQDDSNEEGNDGDSNASTPASGFQEFAQRIAATEQLHKLSNMSEHNGSDLGDDLEPGMSPKLARPQSGTPTGIQGAGVLPMSIDANVLLHTLVLAAGIGVMPKLDETQTLGELVKSLVMANSGGIINEGLNNAIPAGHESNGSLLQQHQHHQQQHQQHHQQQQHQHQQQQQQLAAVAAFRRHLPKSETPETSSSLDANEICEDPILKIPSYKVSGAGNISPTLHCNNSGSSNINNISHSNNNSINNSNRNGDHSPHSASPMLAAAVAAAAANNSYRQSNSSNLLSPSQTSIQKMMATTIQRKINEQSSQDNLLSSLDKRNNGNTSGSECSSSGGGGSGGNGNVSSSSNYKKPSISVAKIIGGTDTSRFGASPNLLAQQHHSHLPAHHAAHQHHQQQLSAQDAAALAAGKGTRPKRGKYRNYDRDSLVEAVKAVQRGEMSVHRAGSYYGVPHSTLEYKVKERHLMRPRKREPKPQPDLVGLTGAANKASNLVGLNQLEKLKASTTHSLNNNNNNSSGSKLSNALKNNSSASAAAATSNGMKLPIFDGAPQLSFQPNMFWTQPNAGATFGLDFNRNPEFLKTHLVEVMRSSPLGVNHGRHSIAHEYTENMYDDIIRKTLKNEGEVGNSNSSGNGNPNALLDQLLVKKTPLPFTNNRNNDYIAAAAAAAAAAACSSSEGVKRAGSPMGSYADIKRERLSPMRSAESTSSDEDHEHSTSNNNNNNNNNNNSDLALNKNSSNNNNNGNSNGNGRSRMTSRDSETDVSSLKSEQSHSSVQLAATTTTASAAGKNKMMDLNGSNSVKFEQETTATTTPISSGSSILHEKLAQIKAEQSEEQL